jgi:hypothetical protein
MKINLKIKLFALLVLLSGCEQEITTSPPIPGPILPAKAFIDSYPAGAEIILNGSITGSITPDTIDGIEEGTYTLTLKKKFFKDTSLVITLKKDTIVSYFIDYTKNPAMYGNLSLNSKPEGALIIINDSVTNEFTPAYIYKLLPGYHNVRFKKEGYWDVKFTTFVYSGTSNYNFYLMEDSTVWVNYRKDNSEIPLYFGLYDQITIDRQGIKWIASLEGLVRFDDKAWTLFNSDNSPMPTNMTFYIGVDNLNNKFIQTIDEMLFYNNNWIDLDVPFTKIYSSLIDRIGHFWAGTDAGFIHFNGQNWQVINSTNSSINKEFILARDIKCDRKNNIWIISDKYIGKFDREFNWEIFNYTEVNPNDYPALVALTIDSYDNVWICSTTQVAYFNGNSWKIWDKYFPYSITDIEADKNDNIWLTTCKGLYKFTVGGYTNFDKTNSPIKVDTLKSVAIDENNHKWFTTWRRGVIKYKGD